MSSEGDTNLDNDGAADCLATLSERLFGRIIELLEHPSGHHYDDGFISELFALIEVVFALHDKDLVYSYPPPTQILPLLDPFIERWKDYHYKAGNGFRADRHQTISETFQRLRKIVDDHASQPLQWVPRNLDPSNEIEQTILKIFDDLS